MESLNTSSTNATALLTDLNNPKRIPFPLWTCVFIDTEPNEIFLTNDPNTTFYCYLQGNFYSAKYGHQICSVIFSLVWIIGSLGIIGNILNVLVLRKSRMGTSTSFKTLLMVLAVFEGLVCIVAIWLSAEMFMVQENINRGRIILYGVRIAFALVGFARTCAVSITILITAERCLAVVFPIQAKLLLTPLKIATYVTICILVSFIMNLRWVLDATVEENTYMGLSEMNPRFDDFPFIMIATEFERVVTPKIRKYHNLMDYVLPFPILLTLNGILYLKLYSWNRSRQTLGRTHRREINAAKMFSIIMGILLLCHSVSCIMIYDFVKYKVFQREVFALVILSATFSASVNILVYCSGNAFRLELKKYVSFLGRFKSFNGEQSTQT